MDTDVLIVLSKISEEERKLVRTQLALILASTYFNSAKQMQRFLEYVAEKTLAGEGNLLKQYTIGVEALGLPDDFDSDTNPVVRIMGGRVRKRLEKFYNNTVDNNVFITIPKGTYTPEFIRASLDSNVNQVDFQIKNEELETSVGPKIALVSFSDKTQSQSSNRLLVRATDCVANELSKFILARYVVFNPYADKADSARLHREIEADYKLYLYIQELPNDKHNLLYRLTDTNREVLWSESYAIDSEVGLIHQESILTRILTMLVDTHQSRLIKDWTRILLSNKETIPGKYQAVAYYRQYYDTLNIHTFTKAVNAIELALDRNSNDMIAILLMSNLCRLDYVHGYSIIDFPLEKGLKCAEKMVHLRKDSHEAHYLLGQMLFCLGNLDESLEELQHARSLNTYNASVEFGCGYYFCLVGRWDEGLLLVKRAMNMSEDYPSWYHMIIFVDFYRKEQFQEALDEAKKIIVPGFAFGSIGRAMAYAQLGDMGNAKNELKEIISRRPNLEKNGKQIFERFFQDEKLANKLWQGFELVMKG